LKNRSRVPDFKIKSTNKVIECHGIYWHKDEIFDRGKELIEEYKESNIDCFIIWEDEWNTYPKEVIEIIKEEWGDCH